MSTSIIDSSTQRSWVKSKPVVIGASSLAGLIVVGLILTFTLFIPQGVTSDGNKMESRMNGWYNQAVTALHNCTVKTARAAQVTGGQTDAVDKVLKDAVGGRYGTGNNMDQAKLFSAIHEAYPEQSIAGLNKSFQDAMAVMTGCQDDFTSAQNVVQAKVADFKAWRTGSWNVRTFGGDSFPNDNLEINIPGMPISTGQAALQIMERPIVDADTANAIKTGMDNSYQNNPFASPSPSH